MTFPPNRLNGLRVVIGQSKSFQITVSKKSGAKAKLGSGTRFVLTVSRGGVVVFTNTTDDGSLRVTDREKATVIWNLSVADSSKLQAGRSIYELWVDFGGSPPERYPVIREAELFAETTMTEFD